jgi:hypothetical protein
LVILHRRHLSVAQQAAIVASTQNWSMAQVAGSNQFQKKGGSANLHDLSLSTVASRAETSGASIRTQKTADKVAREDPELAAQVGRGEISLNKASGREARGRNRSPIEALAIRPNTHPNFPAHPATADTGAMRGIETMRPDSSATP